MIDAQTTVNALLIQHPSTITVLNELGIDACCGGASTLEEVAANDGLDLQALLATLQQAIYHAAADRDQRGLT